MTAQLHADFIDIGVHRQLVERDELIVLGTPIDLSRITVDSYILAGIADHITPWNSCYRNTQLVGGTSRFVLSTNGHIAALVNPTTKSKSSFRTNRATPGDPDAWLETATSHQGSWWPDFVCWLKKHSGPTRPAPAEVGGGGLDPLVSAPGTYVHDR